MQPLLWSDPVRVGGFTLLGRLGEGTYGVVYVASHASHGRVALKVLRPALAAIPQVRARLRSEAQALQRVRGNCTAAVLAVDADGAVPFLAMELVEGMNLFQYVSEHGPLRGPLLDVLRDGLVEALASVHAANTVHRDLKPTNIMFGPGGVQVLDFGISVLLEVAAGTGTDIALGTETWMSPEQAQGSELAPASDVFNLGMVLAFAATGTHPFGGGRPAALMYRVVHEQANLGGVPAGLRDLVEKCLQKNPLHRPDLLQIGHPSEHDPERTVRVRDEPLRVAARPGWLEYLEMWGAKVALALVLVLVVGYGFFTYFNRVVYVGEQRNGLAEGTGTRTWPEGSRYSGEFKADMRHGQGKMTDANGDKYSGGWRFDMRYGQGAITWANGVTYTGGFEEDKATGQGIYTLPTGETYKGRFKDNKRDGQGVLTWPNGAKYTGEFKDDNRDGQGTNTYEDGENYTGEFKDDKRHGQGTLTWPNGDKYTGRWVDGNRNREGTYTSANGTVTRVRYIP